MAAIAEEAGASQTAADGISGPVTLVELPPEILTRIVAFSGRTVDFPRENL